MITPKIVPLPITEVKEFQAWADKGASAILTKLIEAKLKKHLADAANLGLQVTDFNSYNAGTVKEFVAAKRYQTTLEVLKEIFTEQEEHYTVILT